DNERKVSNVPMLYSATVCTLKTCPNYENYCLILPGQVHRKLLANDFKAWDTAIREGRATLEAPPLNVRGMPIASAKDTKDSAKNNAHDLTPKTTVNQFASFPFPFPFMPYQAP